MFVTVRILAWADWGSSLLYIDNASSISARSLSFTSLNQTKMAGTETNHVQAEFS